MAVYTLRFNVSIVHSAFLSHKTSISCPHWWACREEWIDLSLKNTDTKSCASLHISFWTCVTNRVWSSHIIILTQLVRASGKVALLSICMQSRSTGGLLLNKAIYFNRWVICYCATWLMKQCLKRWIKWSTCCYLKFNWVKSKRINMGPLHWMCTPAAGETNLQSGVFMLAQHRHFFALVSSAPPQLLSKKATDSAHSYFWGLQIIYWVKCSDY